MRCITTSASPNCLFLGILPVSVLIRALFNCLMVILNLFTFNLPWAWRNGNPALGDRLTKESFSERLTSHVFFPAEGILWRFQAPAVLNLGRRQLKPCGKTGGSSAASPSLIFPSSSSILCSGSSLACVDHSSAGGFLEMQQWKTWASKSCLGS